MKSIFTFILHNKYFHLFFFLDEDCQSLILLILTSTFFHLNFSWFLLQPTQFDISVTANIRNVKSSVDYSLVLTIWYVPCCHRTIIWTICNKKPKIKWRNIQVKINNKPRIFFNIIFLVKALKHFDEHFRSKFSYKLFKATGIDPPL